MASRIGGTPPYRGRSSARVHRTAYPFVDLSGLKGLHPLSALEKIRSLSKLYPSNPVLRIHEGGNLVKLGRLNEAEKVYREALKRSPDEPGLSTGLAACLEKQRRFVEAETIYRETIATNPYDIYARRGLAGVLFKQGNMLAAEDVYRGVLLEWPHDLRGSHGLAVVLIKRGLYPEAEKILLDVSARYPDDIYSHTSLATALSCQRKFEAALAVLDRILLPHGIAPYDIAALLSKANILAKLGHAPEELVPLLVEAMNRKSYSIDALAQLERGIRNLGAPRELSDELQTLIQYRESVGTRDAERLIGNLLARCFSLRQNRRSNPVPQKQAPPPAPPAPEIPQPAAAAILPQPRQIMGSFAYIIGNPKRGSAPSVLRNALDGLLNLAPDEMRSGFSNEELGQILGFLSSPPKELKRKIADLAPQIEKAKGLLKNALKLV